MPTDPTGYPCEIGHDWMPLDTPVVHIRKVIDVSSNPLGKQEIIGVGSFSCVHHWAGGQPGWVEVDRGPLRKFYPVPS